MSNGSMKKIWGWDKNNEKWVRLRVNSDGEVIMGISENAIDKREFDAKGDLLVGKSDNAYDNLPIGSDGKFLIADDTEVLGVKWGLIKKIIIVKVIADDTELTTGDGKTHITIPNYLNGWNLVTVGAHVYTISSSGVITVQIHNLTNTADMLSTEITIDQSEKDSLTAAITAVIDTSNDDVAEADEIRIDIDNAGTDTKGLEIRMEFEKP